MKEKEFQAYFKETIQWYMKKEPVMATFMGIHDYDHMLADCSLSALKERYKSLSDFLKLLETVDSAGYSKDGAVDLLMAIQLIKIQLFDYEIFEHHRRNPGFYLEQIMEGIFVLLLKNFAPLEDRLKSMLGRTKETPRIIEEALKGLQPERVPKIWAELALEQAQMGPALFKFLLPSSAQDFPEIQKDIITAGDEAAKSLEKFSTYLENEVIPFASGSFAAGKENFNTLLKEMHMVDYDNEELLNTGWKLFDETKKQIETLAAKINPNLTVKEIIEEMKNDHPKAEELLDEYRQAMNETKKFVSDKNIASIPEKEKLEIIETPAFLRPIIPYAAYIPPGIFEDEYDGIFMVTTPDPEATPEEITEKLRGKPRASIPVTTLHEGYPGHHLQLVWALQNDSVARKTGSLFSTLFIEGWAFYCEELMETLGYIDTPEQKLNRLVDQLWRAARIILDVKLHCHDMDPLEAVNFLVDNCQLQAGDALAEVRRYTGSPTQPQSYLMGKLEIKKIIEQYKQKYPKQTMLEMHDTILSCGSMPPKLMKQLLFS